MLRREEESEERTAFLYVQGSSSHVARTGPYGAVRGNAWSGEMHVTARPSHMIPAFAYLFVSSIIRDLQIPAWG
jgi:hypothetical protein